MAWPALKAQGHLSLSRIFHQPRTYFYFQAPCSPSPPGFPGNLPFWVPFRLLPLFPLLSLHPHWKEGLIQSSPPRVAVPDKSRVIFISLINNQEAPSPGSPESQRGLEGHLILPVMLSWELSCVQSGRT